MEKIKFQGREYLMVGDAITTEERFKSATMSYAHLFKNGDIKRYGKIIGKKDDIEFTGVKLNIEMSIEGMVNILMGRGWK